MPIPAWMRYNKPPLDKSYNNRCPNKLRHWARELGIPKRMILLYLVRFSKKALDYDPDRHICYDTFEMLWFCRSTPMPKTAWKFVQMFHEYAPHQILMPLDIFPVIRMMSKNLQGDYKPAYHEHKAFQPLSAEEVAKRKEFIRAQIVGATRAIKKLKEQNAGQ